MSGLLVVEDDLQLNKALSLTLRSRGYQVHSVTTGEQCIREVRRVDPDIIIMDLGLPDLDGIDLIRRVRADVQTPIIVLSARRDQMDKVQALDAGADDYLTKPFGIDELLARIRAAQRRAGAASSDAVVSTADFTVDLGRKQVHTADGTAVHLTPTEWGVLESLVRAEGMLVTGPELLHYVWGPGNETQTNYLRVYMAQLRRKLEPEPSEPRYLITAPGLGYRFDVNGTVERT
jgi:two-component system KDP operon response regulator KdpE